MPQDPDGELAQQTQDVRSRPADGEEQRADVPANDPSAMDLNTLERAIRGAHRRSRIPGKHGKQALLEYNKLLSVFKQRFPGCKRRFWDSVRPPPNPSSI